jgi:hypothetical protein
LYVSEEEERAAEEGWVYTIFVIFLMNTF